jgi:hypothetical protein
MKGFIEIHTTDGKVHLVNISHIVEVVGNVIYTDDFLPDESDFPHFDCMEYYEEIRDKIASAAK